jgi:predicted transposase YdaD
LLETGGFTEMELEAYHVHMDKLRIEPTVINDAKAEGKAEGLVEGLAQGKAQVQAQIVKALHASGMGAAQISAITQLSLHEVRQHLSSTPHIQA